MRALIAALGAAGTALLIVAIVVVLADPGIRAAPDQPQRPVTGVHRGVVAGATPPHHRPRSRRHDTWDDWDGGLDPQGYCPEQG
jgi:hypothetical protein